MQTWPASCATSCEDRSSPDQVKPTFQLIRRVCRARNEAGRWPVACRRARGRGGDAAPALSGRAGRGPVDPGREHHFPPVWVLVGNAAIGLPVVLGAAFAGHWEFPRRIALIDTGDAGAAAQLGFDMESTKVEQPGDHYGHGTAVGSLIRMTAPQAELHSYRVMRTGENLVESTVLLNAMTSATMTIGEYHVVAIPQRATLSTRARGQDDAMQRIVRQNAARGYPTPVIVCAAGNFGPHERMDYPAIVPGVVVAVGLDWSGRPASYNCRAPAGVSVHCVGAIGGIQKDPLGTMAGPNRSARALYGSSYATALVAGSLASAPTKS